MKWYQTKLEKTEWLTLEKNATQIFIIEIYYLIKIMRCDFINILNIYVWQLISNQCFDQILIERSNETYKIATKITRTDYRTV